MEELYPEETPDLNFNLSVTLSEIDNNDIRTLQHHHKQDTVPKINHRLQINAHTDISWLICDKNNGFKLINGYCNLSPHSIQNHTILTLSQVQNEDICNKPNTNYYILAQINKRKQLIPHSVQKLIINDLIRLSQDESVKHDLFDNELNNYLHSKTMNFNYKLHDTNMETPTFYYTQHLFLNEEDEADAFKFTPQMIPSARLKDDLSSSSIATIFRFDDMLSPMAPITPEQKQMEVNIINESINKLHKIVTLKYNQKAQCMIYETELYGNTAFKHCLIDPYKHLHDNNVWIPTIFDCAECDGINMIKSQINGLDCVEYKGLYAQIGNVFKGMQNMFENVLYRKLGSNEKVIVEISRYVLQKKGDFYNEQLHRTGNGIGCVGIYILQSNLDQKNDVFNFCFTMNDLEGMQYERINNLEEGHCIVFRNEMFRHFGPMEYFDDNNEKECKYRTVLVFYILNPEKECILYSNCNELIVNLDFSWKHIICYWLRVTDIICADFKWMNDLIYVYLFGYCYDEYLYDQRRNAFNGKNKAMLLANKGRQRFGRNKALSLMRLTPKHDDDPDSNYLSLNYFDSVSPIAPISLSH